MSGLTRWLVWDRERPDLDGGSKTPAFVDVPVHSSMDVVVVSTPRGSYKVIDRTGTEDDHQRTGSFELDPSVEAEDKEQAIIADFLYKAGARHEWGNVVSREDLDGSFVEEVVEYKESFGLEMKSIHAGLLGCTSLIEHDLVEFADAPPDEVTEDTLGDLMEEKYAVGKVNGKPLFFNPRMGRLALFSAASEYVGIGIRIKEHAAILLHNPERGLVIANVE